MFIIVSLGNISQLHIDTKLKKFFSLWWELLGFTLLTAFIYNIQYCNSIILYITSQYLFITGSLYILTTLIQFCFTTLSASGNHNSDILFYKYFLIYFEVEMTCNS